MRGRPLAIGLVLVLGFASAARADDHDQSASLGLTRAPGAESCIAARELAQQVEARLGRSAFVSAAQADLFVDARIAKTARGWHATVAATRANGDKIGARELTIAGRDCRALDADLVLVIALAIDPLADTRPAPPPKEPQPPIYVAVPISVPAPPPRWAFEARAAALVVGSILPHVSPALDVTVGTTPPGAWPIELGAIVSGSADAEQAGHGAALRLVLGTLATCPRLLAWRTHVLALCGGGAIGARLVRARGLDPASDHDLVTAYVTTRLRGRIGLAGPLDVVAELGLAAALTRHTLYYTALDPTTLQVARHDVYDEPAVGWLAGVGLEAHFP